MTRIEPKDADQRAAIAKLRRVIDKVKSLTQGIDMFIWGTGVVVVHAPYEQAARGPASGVNSSQNDLRVWYVLSHESVHMVQSITTSFVASISFDFANLVNFVRRSVKRAAPEEMWLPRALEHFSQLQARLNQPTEGWLSALHVIEAHAVIEGFRGTFSRYTEEGLVNVIKIAHNLNIFYSDLIGSCLKDYGFKFTMDVFPRLCWLSLQDGNPARKYLECLTRLREYGIDKSIALDAPSLCGVLGFDAAHLRKSLRQRWPEISTHPLSALFDPYWSVFEKDDSVEAALQIQMTPGKARDAFALRDLMPPLYYLMVTWSL